MNIASIIAALGSVVLASSVVQAREPTPKECGPLEQFASIDLAVGPVILVPVTLENKKAWMILDTRNAWSLLYRRVPAEFGLAFAPLPANAVVTAGEDRITQVAAVNSFAIGNYDYRKSRMLVWAKDEPLRLVDGLPVIGQMSLDFFAAVDFELDLARKKLNIFSQEHCPGKGAYWSDSFQAVPLRRNLMGGLYFPVEIDGQKVEAVLATASENSSIATDITQKLYGFDEHSPGIERETSSSGDVVSYYRAMKLATSSLEVQDVKVTLRSGTKGCKIQVGMVRKSKAAGYSDSSCIGVFPLHLGRNILDGLHLYFATREQVLYFTPAAATH